MHNQSLIGQNLFEPSNQSIHNTPNHPFYSTNQEIFLKSYMHSKHDPNSQAMSAHKKNQSMGSIANSDPFYNATLNSKGIVVGSGIEQRL